MNSIFVRNPSRLRRPLCLACLATSLATAAALATQTTTVAIGTLVSNTTFRNPALLARMADTLNELSDGRLILGLGAGEVEKVASNRRIHGL